MGIGDELMLAGEACQRASSGTAQRFRMLDKRGHPRWHFVWDGNPHIARPGEPYDGEIGFSAGKRPYITEVKPDRYTFCEYSPIPGWIKLGPQAHEFAKRTRGAVVFNPDIKKRASPNKHWGAARWKQLIGSLPDYRWIQIGEFEINITGVERMPTPNFTDACGAMLGARALVLHEGALHHAAAAISKPAIVIRGGFISPKVTGYAGQVDFYVEDERWPLGCGMRVHCDHCKAAMAAIAPSEVAEALLRLVNRES